jgi:hypothetical protein
MYFISGFVLFTFGTLFVTASLAACVLTGFGVWFHMRLRSLEEEVRGIDFEPDDDGPEKIDADPPVEAQLTEAKGKVVSIKRESA